MTMRSYQSGEGNSHGGADIVDETSTSLGSPDQETRIDDNGAHPRQPVGWRHCGTLLCTRRYALPLSVLVLVLLESRTHSAITERAATHPAANTTSSFATEDGTSLCPIRSSYSVSSKLMALKNFSCGEYHHRHSL